MPPTTDDLPVDLIERVNALSPAAKGKLMDLLVDGDDELSNAPTQYANEAIRLAWKEETARRIAAYMNGQVKAIPAAELMAQLEADQLGDERHAG